jgi:curved DNA-binding protein
LIISSPKEIFTLDIKKYYEILGVEKNATADQIKKQYRILARKYHPDVSKEKDAEEKFKKVKEAYEELKDPVKRKAYDQLCREGQADQQFRRSPEWDFQYDAGTTEEPFQTSGSSDFFENLFGQRARAGARTKAYSQRGQDIHSKIALSLEEAFSGTERMIQLQEPEFDPVTGQVKLQTRSLKVKIPQGVTSGQQIRLAKQGGEGINSGQKGDLYLEIEVLDHPFFALKNRDVYLNLPVTPWEAALGGKIPVPTLAGKVDLIIPANSQTGSKLRLKGRGLPGSPAGDQYVLLTIYIPQPKTEGDRQLYKKMAEELNFDPRKEFLRIS